MLISAATKERLEALHPAERRAIRAAHHARLLARCPAAKRQQAAALLAQFEPEPDPAAEEVEQIARDCATPRRRAEPVASPAPPPEPPAPRIPASELAARVLRQSLSDDERAFLGGEGVLDDDAFVARYIRNRNAIRRRSA